MKRIQLERLGLRDCSFTVLGHDNTSSIVSCDVIDHGREKSNDALAVPIAFKIDEMRQSNDRAEVGSSYDRSLTQIRRMSIGRRATDFVVQ